MKTYQVEIKETLCATKEMDVRSKNQKTTDRSNDLLLFLFRPVISEINRNFYDNTRPLSCVAASTEFGLPNSLVKGKPPKTPTKIQSKVWC